MIVQEIIPLPVTWREIKTHCRLDDDTEKDYLLACAAAATEAFERETGTAIAGREMEITYSVDDLAYGLASSRCCFYGGRLYLPKGPIKELNGVDNEEGDLGADYDARQDGKRWYVSGSFPTSSALGITVVAGYSPLPYGGVTDYTGIPALIKQAILIHTETLYRTRGATSAVAQHVNEIGLDRIYDLYRNNKALVG